MASTSVLRDNFNDNSTSTSAWSASTLGSGTVAETSNEVRFTLPSSTVGTHIARYTARYSADLTGDNAYINIDTMVSTSVAATAFFQLYMDNGANALQWIQVSGTLYARTNIGNVSTDRYSAAWNATTYKYLQIRETGGNIQWRSSTDGVTWTTRATLAIPFAITALYLDIGATCGNVASPGSFRVEDVNLILSALTTNWRWTQARWSLVNRYKTVTLALDTAGTAQAYLVTADDVDVSDNPTGNVRYWSGPAGDGRLLTEQANQADAEAMAVNIPVDGRFDLPTQIDGRVFRLYHRSIDGNAYTIREFFPRRLVQSDDIEAESIRAINIAAGAVTADKITVTQLSAITAQMGNLTMDGVISIDTLGGLYQGTGTFASPTTGLKLFNSSGIGKLSGYNTGVEQVTLDTDGRLKAGAGAVVVDVVGIGLLAPPSNSYTAPRSINWYDNSANNIAHVFGAYDTTAVRNYLEIRSRNIASRPALLMLEAEGASANSNISLDPTTNGIVLQSARDITLNPGSGFEVNVIKVLNAEDGLNIGSATGAVAGQIKATAASAIDHTFLSGGAGNFLSMTLGRASADGRVAVAAGAGQFFSNTVAGDVAVRADSTGAEVFVGAGSTTAALRAGNNQIGLHGATPVSRAAITGSRASGAALVSLIAALVARGDFTDSTTA